MDFITAPDVNDAIRCFCMKGIIAFARRERWGILVGEQTKHDKKHYS